MPLRPHQKKALESMARNSKGQVIVPTGGGKTMCMIHDAIRRYDGVTHPTIVVVAPRILLAEQLSSEFLEVIREKYKYIQVMHVHSGDLTGKSLYFCSTKANDVKMFVSL